jgi:hypothetical protein
MARTQLDVPAVVASIKGGAVPTGLRPTPAVQHGRIGRQPSPKEIADVLGVDQQRLESLMASQPAPVRRPVPVPDPVLQARFHESLILNRAAGAIRALPLAPPTTVTLEAPIVIWQTQPHIQSDVFIDAQYTPGDAGLLFRVEDVQPGPNYRSFVFFYIWENTTEYYAVVNVSTSLFLTGSCAAYSNTGFFSGDLSTVDIDCSLGLIRNGGWGNDPVTNMPADGTPYPTYPQTTTWASIASLYAQGGGLFGDPGDQQQQFSMTPFDLSYLNMVVPGGASVLFEVTISESDSVSSFELSNLAEMNFADKGNRVACPGVVLEILTPVGEAVTGLTASGHLVTKSLA